MSWRTRIIATFSAVTALLVASLLGAMASPANATANSGIYFTLAHGVGRADYTSGANVDTAFIAAGSATTDVVTHGNYVYWSTDTAIYRKLADGTGDTTTVVSGLPSFSHREIAVNDTSIFWSTDNSPRISRYEFSTQITTASLVTSPSNIQGLTADSSYFYFIDTSGTYPNSYVIKKYDVNGNAAGTNGAVLATIDTVNPGHLATDGTYLYYSGSLGAIDPSILNIGRMRSDGSGSPDATFISLEVNAQTSSTGGVAVDDTYVYWTAETMPSGGAPYLIGRARKDQTDIEYSWISGVGPSSNLAVKATSTKSDQTITFDQPAAAKIQQGSTTLSATASSGLPVSYASATLAVCTASGATVTYVSAGTCTIAANQAGNDSYNAAPQVERSFQIAPLPGPLAAACSPSGSCAGKDLSGLDLSGLDLTGIDFTNAILTKIIAPNATLSASTLTGANLSNANLSNATLIGSTCKPSSKVKSRSSLPDTAPAPATDTSLLTSSVATVINVHISVLARVVPVVTLESITDTKPQNLSSNTRTNASMIVSNMCQKSTSASLRTRAAKKFTQTVFTGANLSHANLSGAHLTGTRFDKANLTGATLSGGDFRLGNFSGANLTKAKLVKTVMPLANFSKANLSKANFGKSDMRYGYFAKAKTKGTKFKGANTKGAISLKK